MKTFSKADRKKLAKVLDFLGKAEQLIKEVYKNDSYNYYVTLIDLSDDIKSDLDAA